MFKEQERTGREVEDKAELRMRRAEKEDERFTELLQCTETNMQVSDTSPIWSPCHDVVICTPSLC